VTRAQARATEAYKLVRQVATNDALRKPYASLCRRAPDIIRRSGLLQGLCFLQTRSKGQVQHGEVFVKHLAAVLFAGSQQGAPEQFQDRLLRGARAYPMREYMALTRDAVDAALWLRRFVQSELPNEFSDEETG
jgi:CRISPR type III-B/RAMP module-associated protein Cmr5